ncbi:RHS repeat domain-containing protein [Endozoicomonas sp. ALE010]|uniref:RHS repeat domain-containing protein n=1 Tax=Endozoicomonas sp. ALE010 TaxID=3403081 RepID=UPI003BB73751
MAQLVTTDDRVRVTYLHPDHLNTPRLATDENQTIVWRWQSDAFGLGQAEEDPDEDGKPTVVNLRFPGQYFDQENGLHYNFHRYYDPETGRYTQSDPIGLMGGMNTYSYAYENPVKFTDPLGLAVYLTYHEVRVGGGNGLPTGRYHLAVLAVPDDQQWAANLASKNGRFLKGDANADLAANKYYTTFSAGPDFNGLPPGKLESTPNRAGDEPWNNVLYSVINPPVISENLSCSPMSDSEFINRLLAVESGFQSTLDYDFFPSMDEDGYNSNSFAIGLLNAAGVEISINSPDFPGAQKPVPDEFFGVPE